LSPGFPYVGKIDAIDHKCQHTSDCFSAGALKVTLATGFGQLANRSDRGDRITPQHQLPSEVQGTALAARSAVGISDRFHILDMGQTKNAPRNFGAGKAD